MTLSDDELRAIAERAEHELKCAVTLREQSTWVDTWARKLIAALAQERERAERLRGVIEQFSERWPGYAGFFDEVRRASPSAPAQGERERDGAR